MNVDELIYEIRQKMNEIDPREAEELSLRLTAMGISMLRVLRGNSYVNKILYSYISKDKKNTSTFKKPLDYSSSD